MKRLSLLTCCIAILLATVVPTAQAETVCYCVHLR